MTEQFADFFFSAIIPVSLFFLLLIVLFLMFLNHVGMRRHMVESDIEHEGLSRATIRAHERLDEIVRIGKIAHQALDEKIAAVLRVATGHTKLIHDLEKKRKKN